VIEIAKKKKIAKEEYAFALVEKAKILGLQKRFAEAINYQEEAIGTQFKLYRHFNGIKLFQARGSR
jgi:hypothetical protein